MAFEDSEEKWAGLAEQSQKGDKRAYTQLLTEISPYIRNIAMKSLSNADAADDVVQEVLISVHKSLSTYSNDRPFKPWLHAIISFRKTDYLRKYYANRQDKTVDSEVLNFSTEHVTEMGAAGELKDIEKALETLPEQQRRIFTMVKIEGYSIAEVAQEMDMKESAVKVSAHRTMKKLQGILN